MRFTRKADFEALVMLSRSNQLGAVTARLMATSCVLLLLIVIGCSTGPAAIPAAAVDVNQIGETLIAQFDKDANGVLSPKELEALPSIAERMRRFDIDRNGAVSIEELHKNLNRIFDPNTAVVTTTCVVQRNGQPLSDAEVRFVPLEAFRDVLPVATGVTDSSGAAFVSVPREELPDTAPNIPGLMRPGLYTVEVTHQGISIPDRYNKNTTLGKEISVETVRAGSIVLDLRI